MSVIGKKTIVDLSRIIAGPYATMVLADFGCRVIKVQPPGGDPTRQWGPPWHVKNQKQKQSAYFMSINRNKQSLVLNLKQQKCRKVLYKLISKSDAVIQNFVPGVTKKLKIDYETLKSFNQKLVYVSVSGFGDEGSKSHQPAFDNLIQAQTGFMHLTGSKQGQPYKLGFAIADVVTSLYAANALLAGLLHQVQTGKGIHLKTSLYESAVASLINQGSNYLNGGVNPKRMGNHHPNIVPYGLYKTKTLPLIICVGTNNQYKSLLQVLNLEDKQEFRTNQLRVKNREAFDLMLNQTLSSYTIQTVIDMLESHKIPCGKVNDLKSLFEGKTVEQLKIVEKVENGKFVRSPIRVQGAQMAKLTKPPSYGEHTKRILQQLELTSFQIDEVMNINKKQ